MTAISQSSERNDLTISSLPPINLETTEIEAIIAAAKRPLPRGPRREPTHSSLYYQEPGSVSSIAKLIEYEYELNGRKRGIGTDKGINFETSLSDQDCQKIAVLMKGLPYELRGRALGRAYNTRGPGQKSCCVDYDWLENVVTYEWHILEGIGKSLGLNAHDWKNIKVIQRASHVNPTINELEGALTREANHLYLDPLRSRNQTAA